MNRLKFLLLFVFVISSISFKIKKTENTEKEWQTLFNGKSPDGWIVKFDHHDLGDNYANTFRVKDGKIVVSYDDYTELFFKGELFPQHCINSSSKTYEWNEWVTGELIVYRDSLVIHIVNGEKVLEYTKPQIGGGVANCYDPSIKIDGKPLT